MTKLFELSQKEKEKTSLYAYMKSQGHDCFDDLWNWSVSRPDDFWGSLFKQFDIDYSGSVEPAYEKLSFFNYPWFPKVKLCFAKNLLKNGIDDDIALVDVHESGKRRETSFKQLRRECASLQKLLGIKEGEVVAAYMPNIKETVVAMLATNSLGGVFTSTSADFGVKGVIDRFGQSRPKVLIAASGYEYGGKYYSLIPRLKEIMKELESVEKLIIVNFLGREESLDGLNNYYKYEDIDDNEQELIFKERKFSDPLYIMYSSGTTGKPKCIVHSVGGTLLQHLKELGLHTNITKDSTVFYFTTCGWMMWNWLVSSLYFGAKTILYEGSPAAPSLGRFFSLIEREEITIFGTSPKFLKALEDSGEYGIAMLNSLKTILSTGAPLLPEQFDFVYNKLKAKVLLCSISGGTDIISCFMLGNPLLPIKRGEIQGPGLGMNISCFDERGHEVFGTEGELVCRSPFISQPIGFLNDDQNKRYKAAYFEKFKNIWHHGDFITLTPQRGVKVLGRSDATLNPGGVRIGTAEIYRQSEKIDFIQDSLCVGKQKDGDSEVWLFVKMKEGEQLSEERMSLIKKTIRENTTPRHCPKIIKAVTGIPYTRSGKKMELLVSRLINGKAPDNLQAVSNPDCLEQYYLEVE